MDGVQLSEDHLKEVLQQCVIEAEWIIKSAGVQVSDELQKLGTLHQLRPQNVCLDKPTGMTIESYCVSGY
jgi:hypothetical protein